MSNTTYKRLSTIWFVFFLVLGFLQFWDTKYEVSGDFFAYSDIADAYLNRDWKYALNSAWPPLFSWLLTIPISLASSPESEAIYSHLLQYSLFILSLCCIWIIIPELLKFRSFESGISDKRLFYKEALFVSLSWVISGVLILGFSPIAQLTPDILQVPIILFLLYLMLCACKKEFSVNQSFYFGLVISLGYYAKSVFIPLLPFCLFSLMLLMNGKCVEKLKYTLIIVGTVFIFTSPFIIAISIQQGRFTIGDSGKINYGNFVSETIRTTNKKNLTEEGLLITSERYPYHLAYWVDRAVWENPEEVKFSFYEAMLSFFFNLKRLVTDPKSIFLCLILIAALCVWEKNKFLS